MKSLDTRYNPGKRAQTSLIVYTASDAKSNERGVGVQESQRDQQGNFDAGEVGREPLSPG
ncbi:hypothetical protein SCLCIDRAFT_1212069 [Scleroderma citrinum Foug A]|uniref:Uncharacterized protein n=1 Tax=Scleroderma citrinum Foug A TaxID=1036808 RepID=A0A0C3EBH6_9AGAM|nr:hypothetical protein SCLCIDRAFT_1212069 [Scleroderma citrinum Foug A]